MNKKMKQKPNKLDQLENIKEEFVEVDPNIIEFEKEAKLQEEKAIEDGKGKDTKAVENKANLKMKKKSNKAKAIVAGFVFLLAVGVGGNWYFENSSLGEKIKPILSSEEIKTLGQAEFVDATTKVNKESEYFTKARVDRQSARDSSLEKLQAIVDNSESTDQENINAANEIAKISKYIGIENKIETLVTAKGVNNCLAVVSADGSRIDIIVDLNDLNEQTIMQIKDVAIEQLGCTFEDVTIIQSK